MWSMPDLAALATQTDGIISPNKPLIFIDIKCILRGGDVFDKVFLCSRKFGIGMMHSRKGFLNFLSLSRFLPYDPV